MKIWLDDVIRPSYFMHGVEPEEYTCMETVAEVIAAIEVGGVDVAHLDYSLDQTDPARTGMDVLEYLELHATRLRAEGNMPLVRIHSGHFTYARDMRARAAKLNKES